MKVLTGTQIRELDAYTIKNEPISSYDLMERAATKCIANIHKYSFTYDHIVYVCGKGNNGGDGLAMARMHAEMDQDISVVVLEHAKTGSPNFGRNLYLLEEEGVVPVTFIDDVSKFPVLFENTLIIDAILGNGLTRPLEGLLADVVQYINSLRIKVLSIDIPTGLFADYNVSNNLDNVINAAATKTIHCPKLSMLIPETGNCAGEIEVVDIGLMVKGFNAESSYYYQTENELKNLLKTRAKFTHKGSFGHALLLAGSRGKMGAAQLAAEACLRSGAGLLTVHVPSSAVDIMQLEVKEAICIEDSNPQFITTIPELDAYSAVGFGPGVGTEKPTKEALEDLLSKCAVPMVIDADGINILAEDKSLLKKLPVNTILTPHPKEFQRLVGNWSNSLERFKIQQQFAAEYHIVLVVKGAHTTITTPTGVITFNSTGNPGLATAGSGDVLTGVILGLLAQGYTSEDAAKLGVWLHGYAADLEIVFQSEQSLMAGDVLKSLGHAFKSLSST